MVTQTIETKIPTIDNDTQVIIRALDTLALALTEHHHQWTDTERGLYEEAIYIIPTLDISTS